jgi:hypothetical protein
MPPALFVCVGCTEPCSSGCGAIGGEGGPPGITLLIIERLATMDARGGVCKAGFIFSVRRAGIAGSFGADAAPSVAAPAVESSLPRLPLFSLLRAPSFKGEAALEDSRDSRGVGIVVLPFTQLHHTTHKSTVTRTSSYF